MKINVLFLIIINISSLPFLPTAQESDQGKQVWAKSVLNEKAPKLTIERGNS